MMKAKVLLGAISLIFIAAAVHAIAQAKKQNSASELQVVPTLDLQRYAGKWYEIARLPNRFQKDCAGEVTATYMLQSDGKINVLNQCRKADGKVKEALGTARKAEQSGPNAILEVRFAPALLSFLPMVWGDYQVIELGPNYEYAVVGEPEREYLWILARTPQMDETLYQSLLKRIAAQGFNINQLAKTRQQGDAQKARTK
jgi:apolipoprotein D and lipocalin family protein